MVDLTSQNTFTEPEAARYIGMSRSFLRQSRCYGDRPGHTGGPSFIKVGRSVRYLRSDLDEWLAAHRVDPLSYDGEACSA